MAENGHIPNSYQTPNIVVDQLMQYLLPEEVVVLTYAIRHILGWRERLASGGEERGPEQRPGRGEYSRRARLR